jgi:hypothetical protein
MSGAGVPPDIQQIVEAAGQSLLVPGSQALCLKAEGL